MKNKIVVFAVILILIIIAIVLYSYLGAKKAPVSSSNTIFSGQTLGVAVSENNAYFVSDNTLISQNLNDKTQDTIAKFDDKVSEVDYSPDHRYVHIATRGNDYKNWIVDIGAKDKKEIDGCAAAFGWTKENENYVYNCVIQKEEYDPDTVNSLTNNWGQKLADLKVDPPLKIWSLDKDQILILTASPGYNTNDLLMLNTGNNEYKNLTQNGFVKNAIATDDFSAAIYTYGENQLKVGLIDLASGKITGLGDVGSKDTFAFDGQNNLYIAKTNSSGLLESVEKLSLRNPAQKETVYQAKTPTLKANQIDIWQNNLLVATDSNLVMISL